MQKKLFAAVLAGTMVMSSMTAFAAETPEYEIKTSDEAIRIVNGKIEIDEPLKAFAAAYQEKYGQEVIIESLGGGVDINGQLKGYLASDNMPDLFVIGGLGDFQTWKDYAADMSDAAWAQATDFAFKNDDGAAVGFPYAVEGYGITYNADILEKAGVDPASLTSYAAYEEAFAKIDGMKEELGIDAVVSAAAESGQMYWSTGNHIFGYYLSGGLERGDTTLIDKLNAGEIDTDRMTQFAKFTQLLFKYSDPTVLISGTYDDQLALWAQGKAAFIIQGNWIDPSLPTYNAEFGCGIAPLAFTEEEMTGVLADSPSWWLLYNGKDEEKQAASISFLNELALSEDGQKCLVSDCGMISPYSTCSVEPTTPLAACLKTFIDAGNTYSWEWTKMPEGIAMNATGLVFELFAKEQLDVDGFVEMMGTTIADYVANN